MAQNVQVVAQTVKKCSDDYYISGKDRYKFVTHPFHRRKIQCRLLRQLQQLLDEFTVCVGQQIVLIDYSRPSPRLVDQHNHNNELRIYGAKPLQYIMDQLAPTIISNLDQSLVQVPVNSNPPTSIDQSNGDNAKFDLPLISDGSTTSLARMKQSQLRTFIPLMIKYSTGRRKIRWGRQASKPDWWPSNVPWENVRCDARSEIQKSQMSWTMALRQIVINCYKYHQREDLLVKQAEPDTPSQNDDNNNNNTQTAANSIRVELNHSAYTNIDQQMQDNLQTSREKSNYQKRRYSESKYQLGRLQPRLPLACKGSSKCRGNLLNDDNELIRRQNLIFNHENAACKTIDNQHRVLLNENTDHQIEDAFSTAGSGNSVNNQSNDNNMYDQSHLTLDFSNSKLANSTVYPQEDNTNQNESITNLNNLTHLANDRNTLRHDTDCQQHRTVLTCLRNSEGDKFKVIDKDPITHDAEINYHLSLDGSKSNNVIATNTDACAQCEHNSSQGKDYYQKYQSQATTNSTRLQSNFSHSLSNQASLNLDHNYQRNAASDSEICPCHQHQAAHHADNITRQCQSCSFIDGNIIDSCKSCAKHAGCQLSCALCSNAIAGTCLGKSNSIVCAECHSKTSCCTTSERFRNSAVGNLNTAEHLVSNQRCQRDKDNVADIISSKICSQESIGECKSHSSCCINNCQISQTTTRDCVIHQSSDEIDQNLSTCNIPDESNRMMYATHINPKGNHYVGEKNQDYLLNYGTDHNSHIKPCTSCNSTAKSQETLNLDPDPDNEPNQVLRILNPNGSVTTLPLNTPMVATVSDRQLSISVQQNPR